ncbi:MAG: hypothetical protein Q9160_004125 [Pyrenula sp. 1 TL-2023]
MHPHGMMLPFQFGAEFEPQYIQSNFDSSRHANMTGVSPAVAQSPPMDEFSQMTGVFDSDGDGPFIGSGMPTTMAPEFDLSGAMDFTNPSDFMGGDLASKVFSNNTLTPASSQASLPIRHETEQAKPHLDNLSTQHQEQPSQGPDMPSPPITPSGASEKEVMLALLDVIKDAVERLQDEGTTRSGNGIKDKIQSLAEQWDTD